MCKVSTASKQSFTQNLFPVISGMFIFKTILVSVQQFVFFEEVIESYELIRFFNGLLRLDMSNSEW